MNNFSVVIENVKLDKYTQDPRIIKMKLWLHFRELLKPYRKRVKNRRTGDEFYNDQEIVDVEVAMPDNPKLIMIRNMEQLLVKKNELA